MKIEIDNINRQDWDNLITQFDDASHRQTWEFGTISGFNPSHAIAIDDGKVLGCSQINIRYIIPRAKIGYALIKMDPVFTRHGESPNYRILFDLLKAIKVEYGIKRNLLIRIEPPLVKKMKTELHHFLLSEGFVKNNYFTPYRTLIIDLSPSIEDLRSNLLGRWRRNLRKAEESQLEVTQSTSDKDFDILIDLAIDMISRKSLNRSMLAYFCFYKRLQKALPEQLKIQLFMCTKNKQPISCAAVSMIGSVATYLVGASNQEGLTFNASYLVHWHILTVLKQKGINYYDLGGINPRTNPGVFQFKRGIAGKNEWDETFLGEYLGAFNTSGRLVKILYCSLLYTRKSFLRRPA